jgi:hypothetical protein
LPVAHNMQNRVRGQTIGTGKLLTEQKRHSMEGSRQLRKEEQGTKSSKHQTSEGRMVAQHSRTRQKCSVHAGRFL